VVVVDEVCVVVVAVFVVCVFVVDVVEVVGVDVGVDVTVVAGVVVALDIAVAVAVDVAVVSRVVVDVIVVDVIVVDVLVVIVEVEVEVEVEVVDVVVTVSPHQKKVCFGSSEKPPNSVSNVEHLPSGSDGVPCVGTAVAPRSYERPSATDVPQKELAASSRVVGLLAANLLSTIKHPAAGGLPAHCSFVHAKSMVA